MVLLILLLCVLLAVLLLELELGRSRGKLVREPTGLELNLIELLIELSTLCPYFDMSK